jgi:hypothetical protein
LERAARGLGIVTWPAGEIFEPRIEKKTNTLGLKAGADSGEGRDRYGGLKSLFIDFPRNE